MATPRIILTTGGTGGHIFPALAVAEQIKTMEPGADLLFIGTAHGPEGRLAAEAGVPFMGIAVRGVLGRGLRAIGAIAGLAAGTGKALGILKRFRPSVVVGFGSYASFPSLVAARLSGIPVVIHEQNAVPGVSNRLMGRMAERIYLSLPDTGGQFDAKKTILSGNPVRGAIAALANRQEKPGGRPRLLVMGGSQGAKAINETVVRALPRLSPDIFIHHQTGKSDFQRISQAYAEAGIGPDRALVEPFISDMAATYSAADLVLCRSGATTVAEIALARKPAVFIPFPYATHDHQTANARAMAEAGAARLIPENTLQTLDMPGLLNSLLHDRTVLGQMGEAAGTLARPMAAHDVAQGILQLASMHATE